MNVICEGWPRRCGGVLFVHDGAARVDWLETSPSLFGWIGSKSDIPPVFHKQAGCHARDEVFAELRRTAPEHVAVETLPHEPPLPGHYYCCSTPEPGNGKHLERLIRQFNPATALDADLLRVMIATLFWGGPGGARPAFVVTSADGRGAGKSKTAAMIGYVAGGVIELSANQDATKLKERLLSPAGRQKRVALLDNVKSHRFSWAELEAAITAPTISGRQMYVGEAMRPNTLTWVMTLNGASLSKDMAQRSVVVLISRPDYSGDWETDTAAYIDMNRREIIEDTVTFLRSPRQPMNRFSRWGTWEKDVLSCLQDPNSAQKLILERQNDADVESEEADAIVDFIRARLDEIGFNSERDRVFIPSAILTQFVNCATNEQLSSTAVSRMIGQRIDEQLITSLVRNANKRLGRGFIWVGKNWDPSNDVSPIRTDIEHHLALLNGGRGGHE